MSLTCIYIQRHSGLV